MTVSADESGPMACGYGEAYFDLAARIRPLRCLEIGTETGQSAANLLLASPKAKLLSVDVCPCEGARERLEGLGIADRWTFVQGDSREVVPTLGRFDWVYVDGDHSYEVVRDDLRNAWARLKSGGTLVVDDYEIPYIGVREAVDEFAREYRLRLSKVSQHPYGAVYLVKPTGSMERLGWTIE